MVLKRVKVPKNGHLNGPEGDKGTMNTAPPAASTANIPMDHSMGAAPRANGEGSGPFGPPQKTSIFHHGAAWLLVDREKTQSTPQYPGKYPASPTTSPHHPDNITHLPVTSKDDADVLWQQKVSHKCRPPWQPPWLWPTMVETITAPAKAPLLHQSQMSLRQYTLWRCWVGALASASAGHVAIDDELWCRGYGGEGVHCYVRVFVVVINGNAYLLWPRGTAICCTHFRGGGSRPPAAAGSSPQTPDKPRHCTPCTGAVPRACQRRWGPRWDSMRGRRPQGAIASMIAM